MDDLTSIDFDSRVFLRSCTASLWVQRYMVLTESDKMSVLRVLDDVRPYIVEMPSLEQLNNQYMESSTSINEFMTNLEQQENKLDDPVSRTDLRIYLGRLRRRLKG